MLLLWLFIPHLASDFDKLFYCFECLIDLLHELVSRLSHQLDVVSNLQQIAFLCCFADVRNKSVH